MKTNAGLFDYLAPHQFTFAFFCQWQNLPTLANKTSSLISDKQSFKRVYEGHVAPCGFFIDYMYVRTNLCIAIGVWLGQTCQKCELLQSDMYRGSCRAFRVVYTQTLIECNSKQLPPIDNEFRSKQTRPAAVIIAPSERANWIVCPRLLLMRFSMEIFYIHSHMKLAAHGEPCNAPCAVSSL